LRLRAAFRATIYYKPVSKSLATQLIKRLLISVYARYYKGYQAVPY